MVYRVWLNELVLVIPEERNQIGWMEFTGVIPFLIPC